LNKTPDFERESTRLCIKCFRRIEALNKQSKDIEDSKREIVEHYEKTKERNKACFGANGDRYKWLAKQSPGTFFTLQLTLYLPRPFAFLKRFSAYTRSMGFRDSIFNVTINSAAVLKHPRLKFTGNVIVTLRFSFVDLQ